MGRLHPITWIRTHPATGDALLAVAVALMSVTVFLTNTVVDNDLRAADSLGVVLVILAAVPLAWRRNRPIATLAASTIAQMVVHVARYSGGGWTAIVVATYSVGANAPAGRRRTKCVVAFGVAVTAFLFLGTERGQVGWDSIAATYVTLPSAFFLGDNMRRRREHLVDLAERAERAEREQELIARERVTEERNRIARDLHDVVAHSVSVMIIQAGAARRQLAVDPERATVALENIESTGREAMQEMRRILGVLRDDSAGADLAPQPSLDAIETLVASDPSLPAKLHVRGLRAAIPAGVELSAYRIVQEALTNVRKHAGPCSRVDVALLYHRSRLDVMVHDNGRGAAAQPADQPGHGLVGMRERVAACGGELRVGPARGGGWVVRAKFPLVSNEAGA